MTPPPAPDSNKPTARATPVPRIVVVAERPDLARRVRGALAGRLASISAIDSPLGALDALAGEEIDVVVVERDGVTPRAGEVFARRMRASDHAPVGIVLVVAPDEVLDDVTREVVDAVLVDPDAAALAGAIVAAARVARRRRAALGA